MDIYIVSLFYTYIHTYIYKKKIKRKELSSCAAGGREVGKSTLKERGVGGWAVIMYSYFLLEIRLNNSAVNLSRSSS